ncbi:MAG: hypothetical protein HYZ54_01065 [Ignavibacteriae bacterium]|nr:hypothetical protein [Ignavibacteriota bacterium]
MLKRILIGTVISGVLSFFSGWLIFGMLMMGMMRPHIMEGIERLPMPDMVWLFVGNLFWGLVMSTIFVKWAKVYSFSRGVTVALLVFVPLSIAIDLQTWSLMTIYKDMSIIFYDAIGTAVLVAIVGGLLGMIFGKMGEVTE